jgi:hypothetical protein
MENERAKLGKRYADGLKRRLAHEWHDSRTIKFIVFRYLDFPLEWMSHD